MNIGAGALYVLAKSTPQEVRREAQDACLPGELNDLYQGQGVGEGDQAPAALQKKVKIILRGRKAALQSGIRCIDCPSLGGPEHAGVWGTY